EDGIRDRNVTGVQTCALPICTRLLRQKPAVSRLLFQGAEGARSRCASWTNGFCREGSNDWRVCPRCGAGPVPCYRREDVHRWSRDRKSTRLNSSHVSISYAVF